ncbi:MAG: protein-glutamate O-methyltransferase CheR [Candidatus Bathyarchaeota archaeon]|nr:protein-glutamate O-methyltransferase CheR [Candidatus Bathyarchaeota archaeon]
MENTKELEDFLEKVAFQKLKKMLFENVGLNCDGYRDEYLRRRFDVRLKATGSQNYSKYIIYLKKNPGEYQQLLNDLTINYTMFMRDNDVYLYLEKILLPKLFASNPVRIWSAGCASGEEPYSLAILAHKILGEKIKNHQISIFASDIDKDALLKAVKGEYQKKQLCGLSEGIVNEYFTKIGETYRVRDFVRSLIHFEQHDLMKEPLRRNLDLILCRNVMIYFAKESQQLIHMNFYNALREGGYLITGKAEMLSGEPSRKFAVVDIRTRVYQKPKQVNVVDQIGIIQPNTKITVWDFKEI